MQSNSSSPTPASKPLTYSDINSIPPCNTESAAPWWDAKYNADKTRLLECQAVKKKQFKNISHTPAIECRITPTWGNGDKLDSGEEMKSKFVPCKCTNPLVETSNDGNKHQKCLKCCWEYHAIEVI